MGQTAQGKHPRKYFSKKYHPTIVIIFIFNFSLYVQPTLLSTSNSNMEFMSPIKQMLFLKKTNISQIFQYVQHICQQITLFKYDPSKKENCGKECCTLFFEIIYSIYLILKNKSFTQILQLLQWECKICIRKASALH